MSKFNSRWILLLVANLVVVSMLGFYRTTPAAPPQRGQLPFSNSVAQRNEMINELRAIRLLLKEQNVLLRGANAQAPPNEKKNR